MRQGIDRCRIGGNHGVGGALATGQGPGGGGGGGVGVFVHDAGVFAAGLWRDDDFPPRGDDPAREGARPLDAGDFQGQLGIAAADNGPFHENLAGIGRPRREAYLLAKIQRQGGAGDGEGFHPGTDVGAAGGGAEFVPHSPRVVAAEVGLAKAGWRRLWLGNQLIGGHGQNQGAHDGAPRDGQGGGAGIGGRGVVDQVAGTGNRAMVHGEDVGAVAVISRQPKVEGGGGGQQQDPGPGKRHGQGGDVAARGFRPVDAPQSIRRGHLARGCARAAEAVEVGPL